MPPIQEEPKQPSFFRRHKTAIIISASIVTFIVGLVLFILFGIGSTIVLVGNSCKTKEQQLQSAALSLEDYLKTTEINSNKPNEISSYKNGDCLTGSGSLATAKFNLSFSSVSEANSQVATSLGAITPETDQKYTVGNTSSSDRIDFIASKLIGRDGRSYAIKYYLENQIDCTRFGTGGCYEDETAKSTYGYMSMPVKRVELTLMSYI